MTWNQVEIVINQLQAIPAEFDATVRQFLAEYPQLRTDWQMQHPEIPDACYPLPMAFPQKFSLTWLAYKVTGAPQLSPVEDIEMALEERRDRESGSLKTQHPHQQRRK